jgi:hypothetical protein
MDHSNFSRPQHRLRPGGTSLRDSAPPIVEVSFECLLYVLCIPRRVWISCFIVDGCLAAPAQDAISYSTIAFQRSSVNTPTKYRGYGPDVDKAWEKLYDCMLSLVALSRT